ncbi:Dynamin GTPase domain [Pyrenophora seminiperda CCB06]|uniref:Dynamin GTPase domain n=1 Tax=Pyrenophora seminiperda CCB06 TaxID=1302712 RepID=A0A3M7LZS3_9PLEO|nr:Dynamin GTPase domain [Pyrenophora seminiperda CCB06]
MDGSQEPVLERMKRSLSEPEVPGPSAPTMDQPGDYHKPSSYIQRLREIEVDTKAAMTSWNTSIPDSHVPSKRKASEALSDSDDSDDEEDTTEVPPYDLTQQRRPKLPIYHPGFARAEQDVQAVLQVFIDFLKAAKNRGVTGEEATYLWNLILKSRKILYQSEIRIAITGDTGSGKSATTNALLGEDLTPEGDSGSACTNVVTEFRQKNLSTNVGAVQAEVQFYCVEYCTEDLVTKWFKVWFTTRQKMTEDEDSVDDNDKAQKDAAFECLEHLFAHRITSESFEDFMASGKSLVGSPVLKKLVQWTIDIHARFVTQGDLSVAFTSSTQNDMREQLRPFRMRAPNARFQGKSLPFSPWPFVEVIRYYVDSPLLQDGICLADVPGSKDINMYRVTAANAYLQECEMTIVVVDIKRATSDQSFRQHYLDAHGRRHNGTVILVATRSDELNDDGGSTLQLDDTAEEELASIEEKLHGLSGEVETIENSIEANKLEIKGIKLKGRGDTAIEEVSKAIRATNKILLDRKKTMVPLIASLEKERKHVRIECHNRHVAKGMNNMYSQNTGDDGGAASFCVSNRMYMRYRRGYNTTNPDKAPTMKLETTQIPAACTYIYGVPSQGRTAVLEHHVLFKVPMLLSIVKMSCSKSTEARVEHVTKIIDWTITNIKSRIRKTAKSSEALLGELESGLSSRELQDKFELNATKKLAGIEKLNAATHRALINKNGIWYHKKTNTKFNLNDSFLSPTKSTMDDTFRNTLDTVPTKFKAQAAQSIKTGFNILNKKLKGIHVSRSILPAMTKISLSKSKQQGRNSFKVSILKLCLHEAPGKRLVDARHAYLCDQITATNSPFLAISERASEDAKSLVETTCTKLEGEIITILQSIRTAFQRQKNNKENDSPEGQKFRKELHELVDESQKILDGVVRESLEKCKEYK